MIENRNIHDWLLEGATNGWCSMVVCSTHDGLPSTPEEFAEFENGFDPCVPAIRVWLPVETEIEHY
jgi:hypothetical protein